MADSAAARAAPIVLLSLLLCSPLVAQEAASIRYSGDRQDTAFAEGRERTILSGNVEIETDGIQISADRVTLFGSDFTFLVAEGNLFIQDRERGLFLSGDRLFYDRERDIARVEGGAAMEDRENEVVVRAEVIESRNEEELAIFQIAVRIFGRDWTTRSEFARFDRGKDQLYLTGLPLVVFEGDEYRAREIRVDTESNDIELVGRVAGSLSTGSDEPDESTQDRPAEGDEQ